MPSIAGRLGRLAMPSDISVGTTIALSGCMVSQQIVFLVILAGTLALFISERVRIDVAAMLTVLALSFTGILTPAEALSGFASEPAIIVAAVFVISAALSATGVTERM